MTTSDVVSRRRLALFLALLLAVPCMAWAGRNVTVFFLADFNDVARESGNSDAIEFFAEGGALVAMDPGFIFDQSFPESPDDGVLLVRSNPTGFDAAMNAQLDEPATAQTLDISFDVQRVGGIGSVGWTLADDDDNPMIDITWQDDLFRVNSNGGSGEVPLEAGDGENLHVLVQLREHFFGPKTYKVTVSGPQTYVTMGGLLGFGGDITLGSVKIVRHAGSVGGDFLIDDLEVSTTSSTSATN